MARPIEHNNGKRAKVKLAYQIGGPAVALVVANKLQIKSTAAREFIAALERQEPNEKARPGHPESKGAAPCRPASRAGQEPAQVRRDRRAR